MRFPRPRGSTAVVLGAALVLLRCGGETIGGAGGTDAGARDGGGKKRDASASCIAPDGTGVGEGQQIECSCPDTKGFQRCVSGTLEPCTCGRCGDGVVQDGEICDGTNFQGETCASVTMLGLPGGQLRCTSECSLDISGCTSSQGGSSGAGGSGAGGLGAGGLGAGGLGAGGAL